MQVGFYPVTGRASLGQKRSASFSGIGAAALEAHQITGATPRFAKGPDNQADTLLRWAKDACPELEIDIRDQELKTLVRTACLSPCGIINPKVNQAALAFVGRRVRQLAVMDYLVERYPSLDQNTLQSAYEQLMSPDLWLKSSLGKKFRPSANPALEDKSRLEQLQSFLGVLYLNAPGENCLDKQVTLNKLVAAFIENERITSSLYKPLLDKLDIRKEAARGHNQISGHDRKMVRSISARFGVLFLELILADYLYRFMPEASNTQRASFIPWTLEHQGVKSPTLREPEKNPLLVQIGKAYAMGRPEDAYDVLHQCLEQIGRQAKHVVSVNEVAIQRHANSRSVLTGLKEFCKKHNLPEPEFTAEFLGKSRIKVSCIIGGAVMGRVIVQKRPEGEKRAAGIARQKLEALAARANVSTGLFRLLRGEK